MKKDPRVYLAQILERIERIFQYTSDEKKPSLQIRSFRMPLLEILK